MAPELAPKPVSVLPAYLPRRDELLGVPAALVAGSGRRHTCQGSRAAPGALSFLFLLFF